MSNNEIIENVEVDCKQSDGQEQKANTKKSRIKKPVRNFPQFSIKEVMSIPKIIGEKNAGNPWNPEQIANALNTSIGSNNFFYLSSASRDYGFTMGTSRAKVIELTALGRKIAFPESENDEIKAIIEAFENIEIFKKVNDYYSNGVVPEDKYLTNTLQETFAIPTEYTDEFIDIFKKNLSIINKNPYSHKSNTISNNHEIIPSDVLDSNTSGELFVIMPFSEKTGEYPEGYFDEVFSSLLVPAAAEIGLSAKTAKRDGSDIIHSTIVSEIYNAQIILADLTEHNPNVLFELGLAIAFKKRVVLIRATGTKAIFDVDNLMRVYEYDKNLWKSTIERDIPNLGKHIQSSLDSDNASYLDILLKK